MVPISPTIALMADFAWGKNQVMASYATVKITAILLTGTVSKIFHTDIFDITQWFVWHRRVNLLLNRLRYSDDVSGCNPKTVSHCPRISGFIQNDSVNPPETQRWKFSKNSLPDISTLERSETLMGFISKFIYKKLYKILFLIDVISF